MPQKSFDIPNVGSILVVKRRRSRNIRLSISASGQIRVAQPLYLPYSAGLNLAKARQAWILKHKITPIVPANGALIGKSYRLHIEQTNKLQKRTSIKPGIIKLSLPTTMSPAERQAAIAAACHRALKADSEKLLSTRLSELASKYGYNYSSLSIKKMTSRWGSCNSKREINLSLFLIQLSWHLIDYVLLHELAHTKYLHHQADFWAEMTRTVPEYKMRRKEIKNYGLHLLPS